MGIHEQIPIQARVKATLAPSPQRLHRSCQSTIVDSHQYPATNLKLKQSIIPLRIQPIPPWSESESHCDKQTSSETKIQPQTAKMAAVPKNPSETGRRDSNNSQKRAQLSHGRGGAGPCASPGSAILGISHGTPSQRYLGCRELWLNPWLDPQPSPGSGTLGLCPCILQL